MNLKVFQCVRLAGLMQNIYRLDAALALGVCAPESSSFIKCRFPPDHPYQVHIWYVSLWVYLHEHDATLVPTTTPGTTLVSQASAHSWVSAHVSNFKGSLLQVPYKHNYGIYIPCKRPCGPKSRVMFKRPWALTRDTSVYVIHFLRILKLCSYRTQCQSLLHILDVKCPMWGFESNSLLV